MDARRRQVLLVAGRVLAILPIAFALWYVAATPLSWLAGKAALPIIRVATGGQVTMAPAGRTLVYTVKLEMPYRPGGVPRVAADVEVNGAKYTYGIALFLALALAARESRDGLGILAGCVILALLPAMGIGFEALKQLGSVPGLAPFLGWGAAAREAIALGYQLGTLLAPTLVPVAIWLAIARKLWAREPIPT